MIQKNQQFMLKLKYNNIMKKTFFIFLYIIFTSILFACTKDFPTNESINNKSIKTDSIDQFVKTIDGDHYTLLGIACKNNNLQEVKKLIAEGADINIAKSDDIYEVDALFVAIENNHYSIVKYLIDNGSNTNKLYNEDGLTPIVLASKLNLYDISELLIKNGVHINSASKALEFAQQNKNDRLIKLLEHNEEKHQNKIEKWNGVYYYNPHKSTDSLGNYYINISNAESDFGYSGDHAFDFRITLQEQNNSLFMYKDFNKKPVGRIYKKKNQYWLESDYVTEREGQKSTSFPLKYAKSADDLD